MDSVKPSAVSTPHKSKLARSIARVLNLRSAGAGIAPVDPVQKPKRKPREPGIQYPKPQEGKLKDRECGRFDLDEELQDRIAVEAILARLFASVSTIKSAYAELQFSQSPYNADGIQAGDRTVVAELKNLSEIKQCYLKKQFDPSPETALAEAEIREQKSLLKTYEITAKKLESQLRLRESEIGSLREKLAGAEERNGALETRLNRSGQFLSVLDNLHLTGLSPSHFDTVLRHAVKSVRSFTRLLIEEMKSAGWDLDAAAHAVQPEAVFSREEHKCFAFESFVSREMFEGFSFPNFHVPGEAGKKSQPREKFFARFMELKSAKPKDDLAADPRSGFASFCRAKYLRLVHPKMESSFFGSLRQRELVHAGEFSALGSARFFGSFAEMAKRVYLLHCLAFSFDPKASIFQIPRAARFSEVYMESIAEEVFPAAPQNPNSLTESDSQVAFTVIPGFRIGKTVIQSKVYLSQTNQGR